MDNENSLYFNFCDFLEKWDKVTPMYEVYQIRLGSQSDECKFCGSDLIERLGLHIDGSDYDIVYAAPLDKFNGIGTLEKIYVSLNQNQAFDYRGHSLSVSDVLVIRTGQEDKAYYVDSVGFKEYPEFLEQRKGIQDALENVYSDHELNKTIAVRNLIRGSCTFLVGDKYIDILAIENTRDIACYYAIYDKDLDFIGQGEFLTEKYINICDELEECGFCLEESIPINREVFNDTITLQAQKEIKKIRKSIYGDMFDSETKRSVNNPIDIESGGKKRAPKR